MINLVIISDIRLYREGLGRMLSEVDNINLVGLADAHDEAIGILGVNHLDVILLDMRMVDNCSVLTAITEKYVNTKIIVMAVPDNNDSFLLCAESGITGYLTNESTIEELIEAIKTVDRGGVYCPNSMTQYILKSIKHKHDDVDEIKFKYSKLLRNLTQRETQVVKLLAEGLSNKQIAKKLTIELSTVKNHVHNILVKMCVESRAKCACLLQENFLTHKNESLDLDTLINIS